jgi:tetratricopeptide (TPR) repeat protein
MMTALAAPAPAPSAASVARAQIESAVALEQAGRYGEAVEQLSHALASKALSHADAARAFYDRGLAYDGLGNMRAAVADYGAALRLDPGLAPALNSRANSFRHSGRLDAAKRDYAAALKCPGAARENAYYGLGLIAQQQGDANTARNYFQKALSANPGFTPAAESLTAVMPAKTESGLRPSQDDSGIIPTSAEPSATKPVIEMPVPAGAKPVLVQLGAFQTEASARAAWDKISAASGDALRGLTPIASPVDRSGKERLWRLRTTVPSRKAAQTLCSALTQRQLVCVPVGR